MTLLNPLTVVYFGSLILGGSGGALSTLADRVAFVVGVGLASLSWQSLLAGVGALGNRHLSPRFQALTSILGNLIVIGLGARILSEGLGQGPICRQPQIRCHGNELRHRGFG